MVMIETGATVYLDTNALIYMTEGSAAFKASIEGFVQSASSAQAPPSSSREMLPFRCCRPWSGIS